MTFHPLYLMDRAAAIAGPEARLTVSTAMDGDHIDVRLNGRRESFAVRALARNYERFGEAHADTMWRDEMITAGIVPPLPPREASA